MQNHTIFARLDDVYIVAVPERVCTLCDALAAALWHRARIRLHEARAKRAFGTLQARNRRASPTLAPVMEPSPSG